LIYQTTFRFLEEPEGAPFAGLAHRAAVEARMRSLDDRDESAIMALYDRPGELRERIAALAERFYREHYAAVLAERRRALEASVASHRNESGADPSELAGRLSGRGASCLEGQCGMDHESFIFTPSMDMGPYSSCAIVGGIHGTIYPLEPEFRPGGSVEEEEQVRQAPLSPRTMPVACPLAAGREMPTRSTTASAVWSRVLSLAKAGPLPAQNNMKFYSITREYGRFWKTLTLYCSIRKPREGGNNCTRITTSGKNSATSSAHRSRSCPAGRTPRPAARP
jgi:hypothetical protein